MEEAMIFRNLEHNELEDTIKNIELEVRWPSKNHPSKLQHIKIKPETSQNQFGTLLKIKFFSTMKPLWQVHMPKRVKLIDSKGELMNQC